MVSIQFGHESAQAKNIRLGSVSDDRNVRGHTDDVIKAFKLMQLYDERAGRYNNVEKLDFTSTDPTICKKLATLDMNTDDKPIYPRVFTIETLLGDYINVMN